MTSLGVPYAPSEREIPARIGPYRIVGVLATGSTSDVFSARHEGPRGFERLVALKVLSPGVRNDPRSVRALAREAAAYARLCHPSIVRLHDFIEQDGELALVLEHIDGLPLNEVRGELHRRGESLGDAASLFIGWRLFAALAAAHGARDALTGELTPVIHADVNPSNVLVAWEGEVKLVDFGSARIVGTPREPPTAATARPYQAPEQTRGHEPTARADVYSACVMLWELLTGRRAIPRGRRSHRELLDDIARLRLPSLASLRPELPPALHELFARGLERDPERRRLHAQEAALVLEAHVVPIAVRAELAEKLEALRLAALDSDRLETSPELPQLRFDPPSDLEGFDPDGDTATAVAPAGLPEDVEPSSIVSTVKSTDRPVTLEADARGTTTPMRVRPWTVVAASIAFAAVVSSVWLRGARQSGVPAAGASAGAGLAATVIEARPSAIQAPATVASSPPQAAAPPPLVAAAPVAAALPSPQATQGSLLVPRARAGHRVWIDGRLVGQSPGQFPIGCGVHAVRVGSRGALESVMVPCGGEVVAP